MRILPWCISVLAYLALIDAAEGVTVTGEVVDAASGKMVPARLYIQSQNGQWFFPQSTATNGSAVRYQKQNWINKNAVEMHTTLSAHPFKVALEPGAYTFTVERGKEYRALTRQIQVGPAPLSVTLPIQRWVDMAARGWFSGDTHTHRDPSELPNVMLAEDLNVALPMVYWTTADDVPPNRSPKNIQGNFDNSPVTIDATHVYYPRNTEYEIFTTGRRQHTLGALLVLNHKSIFDLPALPIRKIAERARAEGALLDLEKHNWPWSMALVPLIRPDLYELANNHHWRTEFSITNWAEPVPAWMKAGSGTDTELHWTLYGFQNYYALLNCGFRIQPSTGTANGVHPVPLGFGRVYVQLTNAFSYEAWMQGLKAGRSFVTTGPMLFIEAKPAEASKNNRTIHVSGSVWSERPLRALELIVNGRAIRELRPPSHGSNTLRHEFRIDEDVNLASSAWVAARCWEERTDGRIRFAHTAPVWFDVPGASLRPRRQEVEWLAQRVRDEIARSEKLLAPEALAEYREALAFYENLARTAR